MIALRYGVASRFNAAMAICVGAMECVGATTRLMVQLSIASRAVGREAWSVRQIVDESRESLLWLGCCGLVDQSGVTCMVLQQESILHGAALRNVCI